MKPIPAPPIPGKTDWERFDNAMRKVLETPKAAIKTEVKPQPKKPTR